MNKVMLVLHKLKFKSRKRNHLLLALSGMLLFAVVSSCEEAIADALEPLGESEEEEVNQDHYFPIENSCYSITVGETPVSSLSVKQLQVDCPEGSRAVGAGWSVLDSTSAILDGQATYFQPSYDGASWLTNATNQSTFASEWKLRVRLICSCEESL